MINFRKTNLLEESLDKYEQYLTEQNKTRSSILAYLNPNRQFIHFLSEKGIVNPLEVESVHLIEFQRFLYNVRDFTQGTVESSADHVKWFFNYLLETGNVKENPFKNLEILPKPELPKEQLSHHYSYEEILRRYIIDQKKLVSYGWLIQIEKHLVGFVKYLRANEIGSVYSVTESTLLKYREYLWDSFVQTGKGSLVVKSQINRLRCVVRLFRYLRKEGILKDDPAQRINDWEEHYKKITEEAKSLPPVDPKKNDITELDVLKQKFLDYELSLNKNSSTVGAYRKGVEVFYEYLKEKGISNLAQVTRRHLLDYHMFVCSYVGIRGQPAGNCYKNHIISSIKLFFKFLVYFEILPKDPSMDLESVKEGRGLPHECLGEKDVIKLMNAPPDTNDPLARRDKAILECLFSSGVRSNELCSLNLEDIDYQQGLVRINVPKGGISFQRVIPIGDVALRYVGEYLKEARPKLEKDEKRAIFLSYWGRRIDTEGVLNIVKKYAYQCGFRKKITTHSLRVTCATEMLKNGAEIRYIQEQLGHRCITSTQRYTRLNPKDLKSVHSRCHPRERKKVRENPNVIENE